VLLSDEIDKLALSSDFGGGGGGDASRRGKLDGVQKELLGLIEGTSMRTRHGMVRTDNILFVTAGAFHSSKPSDLISELQGRLPIQVNLQGLTAQDFVRILTETRFNMVQQQIALLKTEVRLRSSFDSSSFLSFTSLCFSTHAGCGVGVHV
jgi:ATP-dependent HslUV protease ATP-binding subunit HslU